MTPNSRACSSTSSRTVSWDRNRTGRAPTWLQEGVAQWMEGRRSSAVAAPWWMRGARGAPASSLEGSWMGLLGNSAAFAYAWSLAVVESIIDPAASATSAACSTASPPRLPPSSRRATSALDYTDLAQQTVAYLHRQYLR